LCPGGGGELRAEEDEEVADGDLSFLLKELHGRHHKYFLRGLEQLLVEALRASTSCATIVLVAVVEPRSSISSTCRNPHSTPNNAKLMQYMTASSGYILLPSLAF